MIDAFKYNYKIGFKNIFYLGGGGSPAPIQQAPPPPPPPPTEEDATQKARAERDRNAAARQAKGRQATILTPEDEEPGQANIKKISALGG